VVAWAAGTVLVVSRQPSDEYTVRAATAADLPTLLVHRRRMFEDMGLGQRPGSAAAAEASAAFLAQAFASATLRAWIVVDAGQRPVAGGAVYIYPWPPSPSDPSTRRAMIFNVYTEPEHRRRGLARRLMETITTWCREAGFVAVTLHASEEGRPLYEALGFVATPEMRLKLDQRG
jgi:GNAT superfamily N-acetyltransferase